jgi:glycolate oxidase FAD binding subunit
MTANEIAAPREIAQATELLRDSAARNWRVGIAGGGTELGVGYPAGDVDVLLRTTLLDRVVEYSPADLVVEVEAGTTLAALQTVLAENGQRLALDPPDPEHATIGGLLATNTFGPRRARFGSLRDLIVGISIVRADGERVRGGGKVVKNVAGFDLPKIAVGSLGTLGLIVTATFRLHPIPQSTRTLGVGAVPAAGVRAIVAAITAARIEPAALLTRYDVVTKTHHFFATFEGFAAGAAEQLERCASVVRALGFAAEEVEPDAAFAIDRRARTSGDVRVRAMVPPAAFETLDRAVVEPFAQLVVRPEIVTYPSLGIAFAAGDVRDGHAFAESLLAMRRACEAIGGNLVTLALGTAELRERIDPFGTLPAAFPLMRRLKDRFDPAHRLNRGRFIGKL